MARYSEFKTSDAKSPLVVAGMTTITKVGTVPLILSFSRSITDGKVYEKLLNDSKGTISQLIAQNIALER